MFTRKPSSEAEHLIHSPSRQGAGSALQHVPPLPMGGSGPSAPAIASHAPSAAPHEEGLVVIGKGTRVQGKIGDCRKLDVHGILEADVVADMLIVREGGGIRGTVKTDHAEIHGVLEGTLVVHEHLDLQKTAQVVGEISYQTLSIQTGAKMRGTIVCHEQDAEPERTFLPTADIIQINCDHHGSANGFGVSVPTSTSTPIS